MTLQELRRGAGERGLNGGHTVAFSARSSQSHTCII
jgi:hypothetical protein